MQKLKRFLSFLSYNLRLILTLSLALVVSALFLRALLIMRFSKNIASPEATPARRVAIIFGARIYPDGRLSAMLEDRVMAGVDLYHAGKVDVLLMTGDNSVVEYNEPAAMRQRAIQSGVPAADIVVDYGGRRTYDSCYRAGAIFGVQDAILVTQDFHLERALLVCSGLGLDVVGVAADYQRPRGYSRRSLAFSQLRELPATLLAFRDLISQPSPPILGDPLPIFSD